MSNIDTQTAAPSQELVTAQPPAPVPALAAVDAGLAMLQSAIERGASIEQLDRLIALKERMDAEHARKAAVVAMVEFKRNPPTIIKNKTGTVRPKDDNKAGYSYGYADLAAVCDAVIEGLARVGISHSWATSQDGQLLSVKCTLTHELGHSISTTLSAGIDNSGGKNSIQAIGSARTYLCRYTLLTVTGLAVEDGTDDDGAGITGSDRAELRTLAQDVRQGRQRHSPQQVAAGKRQELPASENLLDEARKMADQGHTAFGKYWRDLADGPRGQLLGELDNLTERANAASAQKAAEAGGK